MTRAHLVAFGALALTAAFATEVRADEPEQTPGETLASPGAAPTIRHPRPKWYGGEMLVSDLVSLVGAPLVAIAGQVEDSGTLDGILAIGYTVFLFGGPMIHAANGASAGVVAGSFALRLAIPLASFGLAYEAALPGQSRCEAQLAGFCSLGTGIAEFFGLTLGFLTATAVDAAMLAWKGDDPGPVSSSASRSVRLVPTVGMRREGEQRYAPTFGVAGTF